MITMIGSLKGGSGKSTVTFNLGVWLSIAEVDVLVIDSDPQATLTDVSEVRTEEGFQPPVRVRNRKALTDKSDLQKHTEVLIDVGTANMEAMKKAISLADRILVPVPPSQADIWSTQRFLRFVEAIVETPTTRCGNRTRPLPRWCLCPGSNSYANGCVRGPCTAGLSAKGLPFSSWNPRARGHGN